MRQWILYMQVRTRVIDDASGDRAGVIDCAAAGCTPPCARPEADQVVSTYTALGALLAVSR